MIDRVLIRRFRVREPVTIRGVDLASSLLKAAQFCAPHIRTEAGASVSDALEYLRHGEWEMVLILLEELGDARPQPPEFWDLLADAARAMWLEADVGWYEWRRSEAWNGALRAELCLLPTEEGGRKVPILPGKGLRPMWDIGRRTPEGELSVSIAFLWVEGHTPLEPGECAPVRLIPLTPEH